MKIVWSWAISWISATVVLDNTPKMIKKNLLLLMSVRKSMHWSISLNVFGWFLWKKIPLLHQLLPNGIKLFELIGFGFLKLVQWWTFISTHRSIIPDIFVADQCNLTKSEVQGSWGILPCLPSKPLWKDFNIFESIPMLTDPKPMGSDSFISFGRRRYNCAKFSK